MDKVNNNLSKQDLKLQTFLELVVPSREECHKCLKCQACQIWVQEQLEQVEMIWLRCLETWQTTLPCSV